MMRLSHFLLVMVHVCSSSLVGSSPIIFVDSNSSDSVVSSNSFGSFQTPGFPASYPKEAELRWNISAPIGYRVRLYFSHFDLEPSYRCEYDYVKVESDGELLALFCGKEQTDTESVPANQIIFSPRNSLSVSFRSDFSDEELYTGFRGHYNHEDIDECIDTDEDVACDHFCHNYIGGFYCSCRYGYHLHSDNRTCTVHCSDAVFRERSGVFGSVDYPSAYPKSSDCLYQIKAEPGFIVKMQFDSMFDVEDHPDVTTCPYDYVKVWADSRVYGVFCGSDPPAEIQTFSSQVNVSFHSDDSGENKGWRITYTTTGSVCPVPETRSDVILSPVQSEFSFRDQILFTCTNGTRFMKDGYSVDQIQSECLSDGTWSVNPPLCQTVDCGTPKAVAMADVVFGRHDNDTTFGSTIHYVCREDTDKMAAYNNTDTNNNDTVSYTCGPTGEWINSESVTDLPTCLPGCGVPSRPLPSHVKRIVGGRTALPGVFPWQVRLSVEDLSRAPADSWFGSGALLRHSWVLTAAHVLRSHRRDNTVVPVKPEHVKVFLGFHDVSNRSLSVNRSVEKIFLHKDFRPENYNNDIALLKLTASVAYSDVIRPICLPPAHAEASPPSPVPNTLGVVAGWGVSSQPPSNPPIDPPSVTSDLLQWVSLPVVSQAECERSYSSRSDVYNISFENMFCAGFEAGGRDTCLGDSGGAFAMETGSGGGANQRVEARKWSVFGLVSWSGPEDCGSQGVYGVYTRVSRYVDWIQETMNAYS